MFIGQLAWALSNTGVKLSVIDLYVKLFGTTKWARLASYCLMAAVLAYCSMVILISFFDCRPLAYNWDVTIPEGKCGDRTSAYLVSGLLNLTLDILVLLLPLPTLWNLHMALAKRIGLILMFSTGAV